MYIFIYLPSTATAYYLTTTAIDYLIPCLHLFPLWSVDSGVDIASVFLKHVFGCKKYRTLSQLTVTEIL